MPLVDLGTTRQDPLLSCPAMVGEHFVTSSPPLYLLLVSL